MAIGTPVLCLNEFNGFTNSGSPSTFTSAIAAGSLIVVIIEAFQNPDNTVTNVTDSAGNTYLLVQNPATSGIYGQCIAYCVNSPNPITTSSTITITNSDSSGLSFAVYSVSGANGGLDQSVTNVMQASGSFTTASATTGTLSSSSEIAFAVYTFLGTTLTGFTESTGFTGLDAGAGGQTPESTGYNMAYNIVSTNAAVTYAPTWTPGSGYVLLLATFAATGGGGGGAITLTLTGVKATGVTIG
jgi:hypothetical protein